MPIGAALTATMRRTSAARHRLDDRAGAAPRDAGVSIRERARAEAGQHGVRTADGGLDLGGCGRTEVGLDDPDRVPSGLGQFPWIADDRGDVMPGRCGLGEELLADTTGRSEDRELHGVLPCLDE